MHYLPAAPRFYLAHEWKDARLWVGERVDKAQWKFCVKLIFLDNFEKIQW
jgi:hypothetical protein